MSDEHDPPETQPVDAPRDPLEDTLGDSLGDSGERYERGERIATGGMGEVWRARDTVLGREVAVKFLKREFAEDATFRARFAAEARHAAALHHPGIASVFDYGLLKEGGTPYLVMELVDGKPLSDLLASGQPVDPEQARLLCLQVADALAVAHSAGVVHRDVKPANLLVTPDGRIKITDFGIALATGSVAFTQTGQIVGTPQYLSPEQARGDSATAASDVYALGVVLFECLSGHRPFVADTPIATALAQIQQDVPPLPDSVPTALAEVVTYALAKKPTERYADGAAIAAALRGAATDAAPVPPPVAPPVVPPAAESTQVVPASAPPPAPVAATPVAPSEPTAAPERSRWPAYAAALLAVVVVVALLSTRPWSQDGSSTVEATDPTSGTNAKADTVRVRASDYVGDPADDVESALGDKGLETRRRTKDNTGDHDAGTVASLSPTGTVKAGATITLQVWGDAPDQNSKPDDQQTRPADPEPTDTSGSDDTGSGDNVPTQQPSTPANSGTPGGSGASGNSTPGGRVVSPPKGG